MAKPLIRHRTLVKSTGIHCELQKLHCSLSVAEFVRNAMVQRKNQCGKNNIIAEDFFNDLQRFTKRQYLKQKYKIYSMLKLQFKDDLSVLIETNITFGDHGQSKGKKHSKQRRFQAVSANDGVKKHLMVKNKMMRRKRIDANCSELRMRSIDYKPAINLDIADNDFNPDSVRSYSSNDAQKRHQLLSENRKLWREIQEIKFSMHQQRMHYHTPPRRVVSTVPYSDYAFMDGFQTYLPDEMDLNSMKHPDSYQDIGNIIDNDDEKLLFPDGTRLIDAGKKDDVSNNSMLTPLSLPFSRHNDSMLPSNMNSVNPFPAYNTSFAAPQPLDLNSAFL